MAQRVVIPYRPRPQFLPYHNRTKRYAKIVAHRRFGKTVGCVNDLIRRAALNTRVDPPPRYAYLGPTNDQVKDFAWQYLKHYTDAIPGREVSEGDLAVTLPNQARIRLYGAHAYERLRGGYLDGAVIDEPADIDPRAWPLVVRPTLADYAGWCTFIGTPKGRDWFYRIGLTKTDARDDRYMSLVLKASETGILPAEELEDARTDLTPEQFAQEFECSFEAAIIGAYYGRHMAEVEARGGIRDVPWDSSIGVYTAWDLGIGDATAIWFYQVIGREVHLIDYVELADHGIDQFAKELNARPYNYIGHVLPHDAWSREWGPGKTRVQQLDENGVFARLHIRAPEYSIDDGITAVRALLPRCYFDKTKCARGVDAMKMYRARINDKGGDPTGAAVLVPRPFHNWASHGADGFRYLAVSLAEETGIGKPRDRDPRDGVENGWMG